MLLGLCVPQGSKTMSEKNSRYLLSAHTQHYWDMVGTHEVTSE